MKTVRIRVYTGTQMWDCTHDVLAFISHEIEVDAEVIDRGLILRFQYDGIEYEVPFSSVSVLSYALN